MSTSTNSPEPTLEELQAFYDLCSHHDWYYEYADDSRSYDKGRAQKMVIRDIHNKHPKYMEIYKAWSAHVYSGKHLNTEKQPKPVRPE